MIYYKAVRLDLTSHYDKSTQHMAMPELRLLATEELRLRAMQELQRLAWQADKDRLTYNIDKRLALHDELERLAESLSAVQQETAIESAMSRGEELE